MDSVSKNVGKAYSKSILKRQVLAEAVTNIPQGFEDIFAYLKEKGVEVTEKRVDLVRELFTEFSQDKKLMKAVFDSYLKLLTSADFLKKANEIQERVRSTVELDETQMADVAKLTEYVFRLAQDAGNKNVREKSKEYLAKVLSTITDEDLAVIVKAERDLVDLVKRSV